MRYEIDNELWTIAYLTLKISVYLMTLSPFIHRGTTYRMPSVWGLG